VQKGNFRKDLYYRLSTVLIDIPPLRERPDDILPIFDTFLHEFSQEYSSSRKQLTADAEELLESYRWPGNVRELRNIAEQVAVLMRTDEVSADDLRPLLRDLGQAAASTDLMRVEPEPQDPDAGAGTEDDLRQRELLYRAILEMRMDMRNLKERIDSLMSNVGVVVPREVAERGDFPSDYDDFVVVNSEDGPTASPPHREREQGSGGEVDSMMRDVIYEVEESGPARPTRPRPDRPSAPEPESPPSAEAEAEIEAGPTEADSGGSGELPTLEESEPRPEAV